MASTDTAPLPGTARSRASAARLFAFGLIGHAYFALLLIGLSALVVFLVRVDAWNLAILPALWVLVIVLALRVGADDSGFAVRRSEAPGLFALIDDVRARMQAPPAHEVRIGADVNASIMDMPRFAWFGSRRVLTIGLPLLDTLPEQELRAILAHEFAHLSRRHGRSRVRAVRLSSACTELARSAQWGRSWASFMFVPFMRWYAPRFAALVRARDREHEYESDRMAAEWATPDAAACAIVRVHVLEHYMQLHFWPSVLRESAEREAPPADITARLCAALREAHLHENVPSFVERTLAAAALESDTHPCTFDRLDAMGAFTGANRAATLCARLALPFESAGAEHLLGPVTLRACETALDLEAEASLGEQWASLRADHALMQRCDDTEETTWAAACWTSACHSFEEARPLFERMLELNAQRRDAQLAYGRLLLRSGKPADEAKGVALLEGVLENFSSLASEAADALARFYRRTGDAVAAERCMQRKRALEAAAFEALGERGTVERTDTLRAFVLSARTREQLVSTLAGTPGLGRVYVIQKKTKYLTDTPAVYIAFENSIPWWRYTRKDIDSEITEMMLRDVSIAGVTQLIILAIGDDNSLRRRLARMPGALVYDPGSLVSYDSTLAEWQPGARSWLKWILLAGTVALLIAMLIPG